MTDYYKQSIEDRVAELTEAFDQMKKDMWFYQLLEADKKKIKQTLNTFKKRLASFEREAKAGMERYRAAPIREIMPGVVTREP